MCGELGRGEGRSRGLYPSDCKYESASTQQRKAACTCQPRYHLHLPKCPASQIPSLRHPLVGIARFTNHDPQLQVADIDRVQRERRRDVYVIAYVQPGSSSRPIRKQLCCLVNPMPELSFIREGDQGYQGGEPFIESDQDIRIDSISPFGRSHQSFSQKGESLHSAKISASVSRQTTTTRQALGDGTGSKTYSVDRFMREYNQLFQTSCRISLDSWSLPLRIGSEL